MINMSTKLQQLKRRITSSYTIKICCFQMFPVYQYLLFTAKGDNRPYNVISFPMIRLCIKAEDDLNDTKRLIGGSVYGWIPWTFPSTSHVQETRKHNGSISLTSSCGVIGLLQSVFSCSAKGKFHVTSCDNVWFDLWPVLPCWSFLQQNLVSMLHPRWHHWRRVSQELFEWNPTRGTHGTGTISPSLFIFDWWLVRKHVI